MIEIKSIFFLILLSNFVKRNFKMNTKIYLFLVLVFINCSRQSQNTQLQILVSEANSHTHQIYITFEDLDSKLSEFYTTENFGHSHKVILTEEDKIKLKNGISIQKETEINLNHKHTLNLELFNP